MLRDLAAEIAALFLPPLPSAPADAPFAPWEAVASWLPVMEEIAGGRFRPVQAAPLTEAAGQESIRPGIVVAAPPEIAEAAAIVAEVNRASLPVEAFSAGEREGSAGFSMPAAVPSHFVSPMAAALQMEESFLLSPSLFMESDAAAAALDPGSPVSFGDGVKAGDKNLWFARHDGVKVTEKREMPVTIHFHGDIRESTDVEAVIATIRSRMAEEFSAQSDLPYSY